MTSPLVSTGGRRQAQACFCFFRAMKKTIIYIDGFNLYYRLKKPPYKWLNLHKVCQYYLNPQQYSIVQLKYFTAKVKRRLKDSSNITRQQLYLRALQTLPNIKIIFGQFKEREVRGALCDPKERKKLNKNFVEVRKWEEKESDVNIATHIVADAHQNACDCAVLVSNDTDLKSPLKYVKENLEKEIGLISPRKYIHADLIKVSDFQERLTNKVLEQCQFSNTLKDSNGEFFCPPKWRQEPAKMPKS